MRVKVMTRRRSIGRLPSATYRVVSAAMVKVLPVPALAWSRVMPVGQRPPQTSKGWGSGTGTVVIGRPPPRVPAARPRVGGRRSRNATVPTDPRRASSSRGTPEHSTKARTRAASPSTSTCSGSLSSLLDVVVRRPPPAAARTPRRRPSRRQRRPPRRRTSCSTAGAARASRAEQVHQGAQVLLCRRPPGSARPDPSGPIVATEMVDRLPRLRPMVQASKRPCRPGRGQRQEARPTRSGAAPGPSLE